MLGDSIAAVGNIARHGRNQLRRDALDFVLDLLVVEIEVLGTDEEDVVGFTVLHTLEEARRELHQATGLPETLVLLEQRDKVLEGGMERIGLADLLGNLLDAAGNDVRSEERRVVKECG